MLILGVLVPAGTFIYFIETYGDETLKLHHYNPSSTTRIYDRNGDKIANLFEKKHRYYAPFEQIPPQIIEGLLAIEDTSFFEHPGINIDAIFRALLKDIKARAMVEGASTLTQQLIKNTLLTREKKISRKIKEVVYSLKLERELSKEQILELYLNEVYLGHGYYGIKTAADGYFHKRLDQLTLKEIAILVGLPKAPSYYAPTKHYKKSLKRANRVVARLYEIGWIDQKEYLKAQKEEPTVYNDTLTQNLAPFVVDEVFRELKEEFPDLKTGGYEIYTTIDVKLQEAGRNALLKAYEESVSRAQELEDYNESNISGLNGALISLESESGEILSLVGSVDYKKSSYNRATMGKRQPGSAFKPFIYQVAIDKGYSGATQLMDVARTYAYEKEGEDVKWKPKNYSGNYKGLMSLREAMIHSRNLATINLVTDIGLNTMIKALEVHGIKNLPHDLSLSLGSISLSPLELAKYYTSFANGGIQIEPLLIRKVKAPDGNVYSYSSKQRYISSPEQIYLMTTILRDVIDRGTGYKARARGLELAGKTGTTNKGVDAWFSGYSPTIETIVWFGNDDNKPMMKGEQGGRTAAPAFGYYYQDVLKIYPEIQREFDIPEDILEMKIGKYTEYFSPISQPPLIEEDVSVNDELLF